MLNRCLLSTCTELHADHTDIKTELAVHKAQRPNTKSPMKAKRKKKSQITNYPLVTAACKAGVEGKAASVAASTSPSPSPAEDEPMS